MSLLEAVAFVLAVIEGTISAYSTFSQSVVTIAHSEKHDLVHRFDSNLVRNQLYYL